MYFALYFRLNLLMSITRTPRKVIITGANGFIGKNLIKHLSDFGIKSVKLIDVNPIKIYKSFGLSLVQHSLNLSDPLLSQHVEEDDIVIHLAWRSNPSVTGEDVDAEMEFNWDLSRNLIDVCSANKAKLIFISTGGAIYGKPEYLPIDEVHPTNPVSAYGAVKLKVEEAIKKASAESQMKYVILRPSNAYGPGFSLEKGLGVIGHWVERIKKHEPIQMVGKGDLVRDYIHIDDLCRGILSCIDLEQQILNLGTGVPTSLYDLSLLFGELSDSSIQVVNVENRTFDVPINVLSIDKVKELSNWTPTVSLKKGIADLLDAF